MKIPAWLQFWKRDFPQPKAHNLPLPELVTYWEKLKPQWREQCEIFLYRMDPAKAPFKSMLTFTPAEFTACFESVHGVAGLSPMAWYRLTPSNAWLNEHPEILNCAFLIRIERTWHEMGLERKREVCICNFKVERAGLIGRE